MILSRLLHLSVVSASKRLTLLSSIYRLANTNNLNRKWISASTSTTLNQFGLNPFGVRYKHQQAQKNEQHEDPPKKNQVQILCEQNKLQEAFDYFKMDTSLENARYLINYYSQKGGRDSMKRGFEILKILEDSKILPTAQLFSNLMYLCNSVNPRETFNILSKMERYEVKVDEHCFSKLAFASSKTNDLMATQRVTNIFLTDRELKTTLSYLKHLLSVLSNYGAHEKALVLADVMRKKGLELDVGSYIYLLKACEGVKGLENGKKIHEQIMKAGFQSNSSILMHLSEMYVKHKDIDHSLASFEKIHNPSIDFYNRIITLCSNHQQNQSAVQLFEKLKSAGLTPSELTYSSVLTSISHLGPEALEKGKQIHQQIIERKLDLNRIVIGALIEMYDQCGEPNKSIELYDRMIENNITPYEITFTNVLSAISNLGPNALEKGKQIHQRIIQRKFDSNIKIINALIRMYDKCGEPNKSIEIYDQVINSDTIPDKFTFINTLLIISNLGPSALEKGKQVHQHIVQYKFNSKRVLSNILIQMYDKCGEPNKSIEVYDKMIENNNITPDEFTFTNILTAISNLGPNALEKGKQIHQQITQQIIELNPKLQQALNDMYEKCKGSNK